MPSMEAVSRKRANSIHAIGTMDDTIKITLSPMEKFHVLGNSWVMNQAMSTVKSLLKIIYGSTLATVRALVVNIVIRSSSV